MSDNAIDLLTSAEVAELLRTTPASIRVQARRGLIPRPVKLPGLGLRWRRADLAAWIDAAAKAGAA